MATTNTSSAYVKWVPKLNAVGPNVIYFEELVTASASGIALLLKIPHGARITGLTGLATGVANEFTIGDASSSTRYVTTVSPSGSFFLNLTTGFGHVISVTDSSFIRYTDLRLSAHSVVFSATVKFRLEYIFDGYDGAA